MSNVAGSADENKPSALTIYPALAEALDELIDQYGLDLVMDAVEEIADECE